MAMMSRNHSLKQSTQSVHQRDGGHGLIIRKRFDESKGTVALETVKSPLRDGTGLGIAVSTSHIVAAVRAR